MMVAAFSMHARIWEENSTNHSKPAVFFFFFEKKNGNQIARHFHSFGQDQCAWFRDRKQLRTSVP